MPVEVTVAVLLPLPEVRGCVGVDVGSGVVVVVTGANTLKESVYPVIVNVVSSLVWFSSSIQFLPSYRWVLRFRHRTSPFVPGEGAVIGIFAELRTSPVLNALPDL